MLERLVIDTRPGRAPAVAARLHWADDFCFAGCDGDRSIRAVWRPGAGRQFQALSEALRAVDGDIVDVSFVPER